MDTATKGYRVGKKEKKMGLRGSDTVEIVFEDCFIPDDQVIGELTGGFKAFMKTLTGGRISIGALALGCAQGAYEHSLAYAKVRRQFGRPIAEFQAISFALESDASTPWVVARRALAIPRPKRSCGCSGSSARPLASSACISS